MAAISSGTTNAHQTLAAPAPYAASKYNISPRPTPSPFSRATLQPANRHIWIVAGTSCCGKTTVARRLASQLGTNGYVEGDDFHPQSNKEKMSSRTPLTDADRAPWLRSLRSIAVRRLEMNSTSASVVVTCSSLKKQYRDVFREAEKSNPGLKVHFLFLQADVDVLIKRSEMRAGHFFGGADMIKSQFADLETPVDERDAVVFECSKSEIVVAANVLREVQGQLSADSFENAM